MIRQGRKEEAGIIAQLIMQAMTTECCLFFCGEGHTAEDFHKVMTMLVEREDTQYSYLNTLCAVDDDDKVLGISVSYDGGKLLTMRQIFIDSAIREWGQDHSNMPEETEEGELYLDSLAVFPEYQGRGLAKELLRATAEKAKAMGLLFGLLVDDGNPKAEAIYKKVGFHQVGTNNWGGHPMKHLQMETASM